MRKILWSVFILFVCACPAWAEDAELQSPGDGWILQYRSGWSAIRLEDGLKLPVPADAVILDCGGVPGTLEKYMTMDMLKAVVSCTNATDKGGELHVQKVQVLCE